MLNENTQEMTENLNLEAANDTAELQPLTEENTPELQPTPEAEPVRENIAAKHFKRVNEEKERIQRERDELKRLLEEERNRNNPQVAPNEDDFEIDENNFAEGKDLKRFVKEVRELKQELYQYKQKTALEVTETKLKTEFPDFNQVFSDDNIALFKAEHPELAETILGSNASPYSVAKSAYKMIKQLGIHVEDNSAPERAVVQRNLSKPRPAVSVAPRQGSSPLSRAEEYGSDDLTEERAAALRREIAMYKNQ
jgi:hypothetical protein